ncbi:hypothetical protein N9N26_06260, partial [Candidatus Poseidoniales archaeon]|nr:hypothetical protein [Candidatus Poseidoniales archaeon]
MKDRIESVFTGDEIIIPKPLFGFAMDGSHEKTNNQLRQMIRNDRRLDSPLRNFDSSLQNALREHCNVTGKDYNLMLKKRIESGHHDIAAWDAKWVGAPPLVVSGRNLNHTVPVTPARICLVANPDQYDID